MIIFRQHGLIFTHTHTHTHTRTHTQVMNNVAVIIRPTDAPQKIKTRVFMTYKVYQRCTRCNREFYPSDRIV